jgi:hypothetical protein
MKMRIFGLSFLACLLWGSVAMWGQTNSAADILKNPQISGSALLTTLPYFEIWSESGESEIMLQGDVSKGMRVFANRNDAEMALLSSRTLSQGGLPLTPLIINAYPALGYQLALKADSGSFLREGLTVQEVFTQLGAPEQVRERIITSDDREVKPIFLKEYSYASGAVVFAVFTDSLDQNNVDLVFLNVPAVAAALPYGGAR